MFSIVKKNRMIFFILFALCVAGIIFGLYVLIGRTNPQLPSSQISIGGKVFTVELAQTVLQQARGLSGRDGLPEDGGMLFLFSSPGSRGIWMKDMKFAIDIVWIRGDSSSQILPGKIWEGKVVGFAENAQPEPGKALWSLKIYYPPEEIDIVLEVVAGMVKKYGLKVGDAVVIK